ncbi:MAG: MFS transporter [Candidatus Heimdallarchaeota archaeon]|nr:MFS transporter [Candidatus Heimdallarchaeota archaeon]
MNETRVQKLKDVLPPKVAVPLLFSYLVEHIAISLYWVFFGISLEEDLGASFFLIALVLSAPSIVSIFGTSLFSSIADRIGHHKELMVLSRIFLMTQYILLIFFRTKSIWVNLIILSVFALFTQAFYILNSSLITIISKPSDRGKVTSFQTVFASAGWMIGSGLSAVIKSSMGIEGNLAFAAGLGMVAGLVTLFSSSKAWNHDQLESVDKIKEDIADLKQEEIVYTEILPKRTIVIPQDKKKQSSYWSIFKKKEILILLLVLALLDFGFGPFNTLTGLYLVDVGLNNNFISLSNVIATLFGLIFSFAISRPLDKRGRKPFLIIALVAYPVIYGLMFLLSNYWIAIFIVYNYPLYAIKVPTANTIMADHTTEKERSRGLSLVSFEQIIMASAGGLIAAAIADNIELGIRIFPLFPVAFGIIALILGIFFIKESNQEFLKLKKESERMLVPLSE